MKSTVLTAALCGVLTSVATSQIPIPPHASVYNGFSRGFNFTAGVEFFINKLDLPLDAFQTGDTASYMIHVNGTEVFRSVGNAGAVTLNQRIQIGDVVDIIGNWSPTATGNFTAHNSYGNAAPYATTIEGVAHTLNRTGWQWDIGDPGYTGGTMLAPTTGAIGRVLVYTNPPSGLWPSFDATPTSGGANLQVTFTDTTFSSRPGGVISQTWDFGDGSPTVTGKTVTHTYTCGSFSPKLTVIDANETKSLTRTDLIQAGTLSADFTATPTSGVAPVAVTFTDTTGAGGIVFQWDFGDGNSSSQQNPTHTYTTGGSFDVKLTVIGPCNTTTITKQKFINLRNPGLTCLETTFAGGNGLTANDSGNMFDVVVKNPKGIRVTDLDVSVRAAAGTSVAVDVYMTPTTYVGKDADASQWVQVSSGSGSSAGALAGDKTAVVLDPFLIPAGSWGLYVVQKNGGIHYTNGNGTNQSFSNADLDITLGIAKSALFSGSTFNPRVWNGTICYSNENDAANGAFGFGCAGTGGVIPEISLSNEPVLGNSVTIDVTGMVNVPAGAMWIFLGVVSNAGLDLTPLGAPGCFLFSDPIVDSLGFVNTGGTASLTGTVPNNASLIGAVAALTAANVDAGSGNALGVASTAGHAIRLGN